MEILLQRTLDNGMTLTVENLSRKIAGDRWLVRVSCQATIPVSQEFLGLLPSPSDPSLHQEILARLGQEVAFVMHKERNFVDDQEQPDIVKAMVDDITSNMLSYLATPSFPQKLLAKRYEEARQSCRLTRQYEAVANTQDDDEGPADFSACFKD